MEGLDTVFCREEWIPDLVSGNLRQATGYLAARAVGGRNHYCCLGVAGRKLGKVRRQYMFYDASLRRGGKEFPTLVALGVDGDTSFLPTSVGKKIGLLEGKLLPLPEGFSLPVDDHIEYDVSTLSYTDTEVINLARLNDDMEYSFKQIAEVIEKVCKLWDEYYALHNLEIGAVKDLTTV